MESLELVVRSTQNHDEEIIKKAILLTFKELSLLADSLVETAKKQTSTREEYICFIKGAAFLFYNVCARDDSRNEKIGEGIKTVQDAINHCYDLMPFMRPEEKEDHEKLVNWLNELLQLRGEDKIIREH